MRQILTLSLMFSTIRLATPLVWAAIGGLYSERSGVINIALEGLMLAGAFTAAAVTFYTHSAWAGVGAAMLSAAFFALLLAVIRIRYIGVVLSGVLAGVGGAYLSIGQSSLFTRNMTAGRGFIALAALIFGKWRPVQTMLACVLFGFADALTIQMQGVVKLPSGEDVPVQFIQMIPYVVTIVVLAGFIGQSRAPGALGVPYDKES